MSRGRAHRRRARHRAAVAGGRTSGAWCSQLQLACHHDDPGRSGMRRMRIVRTLGTLELGGAQLSALRLSAAVRRHGTATTLLAGDATAPGLEVAARCGLPADAYRMRDRHMLASLQWTPPPGFARWLGPRLGRAGLVHAHMVGGWRAAARALPPDVPLVASEHNEMCWPGRAHAAGRAAARRVGMFFAHGPASGAWAAGGPGRRPAARGALGAGRTAGRTAAGTAVTAADLHRPVPAPAGHTRCSSRRSPCLPRRRRPTWPVTAGPARQ